MIEKLGGPVNRAKEVREGNERSNRLSNFVRKLLFYSGGYQVLKGEALAGNPELASDIAEYFRPEISNLRRLRGANQPGATLAVGSDENLREIGREVIRQRAKEIDQLFSEAGIDTNDLDAIVARAIGESEMPR